jgi:putative endonuclease
MYVYILQCNDNSYYTGVTNNLDRRLSEHNAGLNIGCYTYSRRPLKLEFYEIFDSPASAIAFEKKLKGWSKAKKKALIDKNWEKLHDLSRCRNETSHENFRRGFDFAQPDTRSEKKGFDFAQPD